MRCTEGIGQDYEKNSLFVALYLFQFSFLTALEPLVPVSVSSIIFSVVLLFLYFMKSRESVFRIPVNVLLFSLCVVILILVKGIRFPKYSDETFRTLYHFLTIGILSLYFSSRRIDCAVFLERCKSLSVITFFMLVFIPVIGLDKFGGYMRFGYALLPLANIFFYFLSETKEKSLPYLILYILTLFEMTVFGARGSLFAHLLFIVCVLFFLDGSRKKFLMKVTFIVAGFFIFFNLENILLHIKVLFNDAGYRVYAIDKYLAYLQRGFEYSSSGRDVLWNIGIDNIQKYPLFGGPVGVIPGMEDTYYHNFFIQLGAEFGIPIMLFVISIMVFMFVKAILKYDEMSKGAFFFIFTIAMGRLMFSSSYWLRPEFWMVAGMWLSGTFTEKISGRKTLTG